MMLPEGSKHPPPKEAWVWVFCEGIVMFDDTEVEGLMTMMFESMGAPMTLPFGASVKLL
jgi:hypothetical protein